MRTVGEVLKETREAKLLTLEEVEKSIKIRKELLLALEADDYSKLPPPTFVQGFIKNYARFLDLDGEKLLAIFRREFSEKKHKPYVMEAFAKPPEAGRFKLTPGKVFGGVISLIIIAFFIYLWLQYRQFAGAPSLTLTSPPDQLTTDSAVVIVSGRTEPETKVAVNGQEVPLNPEGDFKEEITLSSEVNKVVVVAVSKFGQKTQIERTVYLKR